MRFCTSCGHELGVGRFCTNCGHAIDRSAQSARPPSVSTPPRPADEQAPDANTDVDTAERRAARRSAALEPMPPRTPPAAADTPPAPRFPLFADEVGPEFTTRVAAHGHRAAGTPELGERAARPDDTSGGVHRLEDSSATHRWDTGAIPATGLLDRFGGREIDAGPGARSADEALASLHAAAQTPADHQRHQRSRRPRWPWLVGALVLVLVAGGLLGWRALHGEDDAESETATDSGASVAARDVAAEASAATPGDAQPATEVGGGRATFVAANLLDGDPSTAWRVAGDASGKEIVFTLPSEATISQVGLINGYAKRATDADGKRFDWYHGNRTVTKVAWLFDDETLVDQTLERDRELQTIPIDDVTTTTITLRLLEVSEPGTGRASRDFTAISDVSLTGVPSS